MKDAKRLRYTVGHCRYFTSSAKAEMNVAGLGIDRLSSKDIT